MEKVKTEDIIKAELIDYCENHNCHKCCIERLCVNNSKDFADYDTDMLFDIYNYLKNCDDYKYGDWKDETID